MEKRTKITYVLSGLTILSVILHNAIFGFLKIEEPVFFILTLVFGLGFAISVVRDVILVLRKKEPLSNDFKISLVTVICLLVLAIASKNVLRVRLDFISLYGPVWMYITYIITRDKQKESKVCSNPLFWSAAIIFVTLAILTVYAI